MHLRRAVILAATAIAATCISACDPGAAASGGVITIGVDLPLSGADAPDGVPTENGVTLAIRDANQAGLIPGFSVQADIRDDAVRGVHDPRRGAENLAAFIDDPLDLGVVGPLNSNVAEAMIPLGNAADLAIVSPSNTNPALTKGPEAMRLRRADPLSIAYFRVSTTDDLQGAAGAAFAYRVLGARRAYVIDDDQLFGRGLADEWATEFRSEGGIVLGHEHAARGQRDFSATVRRAASADPDVVFFGGDSSTGAADARREMAGTPLAAVPYESGDGIMNQRFLDVAGPEAEHSFGTVAAVDAARLQSAQAFVTEYRAAFGHDVGDYSANAYAATTVLVQAIARAVQADRGRMPSRDDVLAQLRSSAYSTILGTLAFDENGDTDLKIISVWEVRGGRWSFVSQRDYGANPTVGSVDPMNHTFRSR